MTNDQRMRTERKRDNVTEWYRMLKKKKCVCTSEREKKHSLEIHLSTMLGTLYTTRYTFHIFLERHCFHSKIKMNQKKKKKRQKQRKSRDKENWERNGNWWMNEKTNHNFQFNRLPLCQVENHSSDCSALFLPQSTCTLL